MQQATQPQPTASIEGVIIRTGTSDPVARAKVTITPDGGAAPRVVNADGEGRFVIRDVAAGRYRLNAARDGFVTAEYGQRGPNSSGVPLNLADRQAVKDVSISLTPTGAIAGRVINRFGEVVGNANVQASRYTYQDGRRVLTPVQTVRTNDLGEFRLYWMAPGQYIVSAQPPDNVAVDPGGTVFMTAPRGAGGAGPLGGLPPLGVNGVTQITITGGRGGGPGPVPTPAAIPDNPEVYLPVYYPGTTDLAAANSIDLRPGATFGGINLTVAEARPVRIRGQVLNGGQPARGASVSIFPKNQTGGLTVRSAPVNDSGAFEFRNIAPGSYELAATLNGAATAVFMAATPAANAGAVQAFSVGGRGAAPAGPRMAARSSVDVLTSDVEGLSLVLQQGFNVAGRVTVDGRAGVEGDGLASLRLQLQSEPNVPPLALPAANLDANSAFLFEGVTPGSYRLSVNGLPRNMYLKSARLGGVDILNGGLSLDGDPRGGLDVVLGTSPAVLQVNVVDEKQLPVPAVTVVLVPDFAQQKRFELYRSTTADASGLARFDTVVPGDYKVYAWEDVEPNVWTDPDFMRGYENRGVAVHIDEGGRPSASVKVIPYR